MTTDTQAKNPNPHPNSADIAVNHYSGPPSGEFRPVSLPDNFTGIRIGITQRSNSEDITEPASHLSRDLGKAVLDLNMSDISSEIPGFEDVLDEPLGTGLYYNTAGSVYQLTLALSLSENPAIAGSLVDKSKNPAARVKEFREAQVLSGLKVLDLGCGKNPSFALAAKAMGARVYTADAQDLDPGIKSQLDEHVIVDLNDPRAASRIEEAAGRQFDLVTENIIDAVPLSGVDVKAPEEATLNRISEPLLKEDGHAFYMTVGHQEILFKKS
jgi:hypothetical protein